MGDAQGTEEGKGIPTRQPDLSVNHGVPKNHWQIILPFYRDPGKQKDFLGSQS